jgi:hypothetical protein
MFNIAEIFLLILALISLLIAANKHGKEKLETANFWHSVIGVGLQIGLMYWAGLFH